VAVGVGAARSAGGVKAGQGPGGKPAVQWVQCVGSGHVCGVVCVWWGACVCVVVVWCVCGVCAVG